MPIEKLRPSFSFDEERIKQLRQIAPEAFADNQVNWEVLKEALGNYLEEDDVDIEHFGLFWPGKREARRMASIPSKGTLVPCPGEGIDEENTRNIFIEGENLEVLKILQKSYAGKIKMIYIDPPYNTGNDFVYDDDFTEPLEEYLRRTGQIDEEGKPLTTNKKADGRFHSKWLSMMYPRLRLARNLLRDDGVIFISIDDNELQNLKILMNEIFGEENFLGQIIIQSNPRGSQASKYLATTHEYLLMYSKSEQDFELKGFDKELSSSTDYNLDDGDGKKYRLLGLRQRGGAWRKEHRPKLHFPLYVNSMNGLVSLEKNSEFRVEVIPQRPTGELGRWTWSKDKIKKDNHLLIGKPINRRGEDNAWDIFRKDHLIKDDGKIKTQKPKTIWTDKELNYQNGGNEIKKLFGNSDIFDFPKPTFLIKNMIDMFDLEDDLVLDFFVGSGTTAHAVLNEITANNNLQFICVQLPENIEENHQAYRAGYKTISELCKERIRRVCNVINKKSNLVGFRSFKLTYSNYKNWTDAKTDKIQELTPLFENLETSLVDGWVEENLMTEILLLEGFPLNSKIAEIKEYDKNKIQEVTSDFCEHKLLICLDKKVHSATIKNLQLGDTDIFICLDNAITDEEKVTLADKGLIKTI